MVRAANEKMLGANLPSDYVEGFWGKAAPEGISKTLIIKSMCKVWLDLTDELKRNNLYPIKEEKSLSEIIEAIVDKKIKNAIDSLTQASVSAAVRADEAGSRQNKGKSHSSKAG